MANKWWDEVRIPYAQKVEEVVKKFGAETYYEIHLADGRDRIIGLYFSDKIPPGWRKDSKYYNCCVPHRTTKLGKQYAKIFRKIQDSPVMFEPIRKALDLPLFWDLRKMKKAIYCKNRSPLLLFFSYPKHLSRQPLALIYSRKINFILFIKIVIANPSSFFHFL